MALSHPPSSDILVPVRQEKDLRCVPQDAGVKPSTRRAALRRVIQLAADAAGPWGSMLISSATEPLRLHTDLLQLSPASVRDEVSQRLQLLAEEPKRHAQAKTATPELIRLTGAEGTRADNLITDGWLQASTSPSRPPSFGLRGLPSVRHQLH